MIPKTNKTFVGYKRDEKQHEVSVITCHNFSENRSQSDSLS